MTYAVLAFKRCFNRTFLLYAAELPFFCQEMLTYLSVNVELHQLYTCAPVGCRRRRNRAQTGGKTDPEALQSKVTAKETEVTFMSDNDPDKVWPTGLTLREAEEVHSYLIDGTRVFGVIALLAHILVAASTPWLG